MPFLIPKNLWAASQHVSCMDTSRDFWVLVGSVSLMVMSGKKRMLKSCECEIICLYTALTLFMLNDIKIHCNHTKREVVLEESIWQDQEEMHWEILVLVVGPKM